MKKAIFVDKDGTLVYDVPYNVNTKLIKFTKDAFEGLKALSDDGYELFIITNQHGVALGHFTEKEFLKVKEYLEKAFLQQGIKLAGLYYCPHHKDAVIEKYRVDCDCRKPKAGMILKAAKDSNIDTSNSWMIGDTPNDIEAGKRAGCRGILFDKGYENIWEFTKANTPETTVKTLKEASDFILKFNRRKETFAEYERRYPTI